jgi:hypothetical protein
VITDRLARAEADLADLSDVYGDSALVAGIRCAALGVPQPWATYARPVTPPPVAGFELVAVSAAASRLAVGHADTVRLHAADEAERIYQRIGYRRVDEHVLLTA